MSARSGQGEGEGRMVKITGEVFKKIVEYAGRKGLVRLFGYGEPHATWVQEGGRLTRAWHYHRMVVAEIELLGGRFGLRVRRIDLLTFLTRAETYECATWDELFDRLEKVLEEERVDRLDMEKQVTETIWTAG
jgi:hypothetical protein